MENKKVLITECPRDAMQGIHDFIPTQLKINYINDLLSCGFDTLDFGSFVSPKAIPQLKDTTEVLNGLIESDTKLLAIVANERGAEEAAQYDRIHYLGYPFSISETFQLRNTNATIEESLKRVDFMNELCEKQNKALVLYLSMGFGNPYGDKWSEDLVAKWATRLNGLFNIARLSLSDTVGAATSSVVSNVFRTVIPEIKNCDISAHLHVIRENAQKITKAAFESGCTLFEGAIKGYGGCPMAADELTGNMPTELMLDWFNSNSIQTGVNQHNFEHALVTSGTIFH